MDEDLRLIEIDLEKCDKCNDYFNNNDITTECGHKYHMKCLYEWNVDLEHDTCFKCEKKIIHTIKCPICLNTVYNNDMFTTLCGHDFHISCMEEWIHTHNNNTCPICNEPQFSEYNFIFSDCVTSLIFTMFTAFCIFMLIFILRVTLKLNTEQLLIIGTGCVSTVIVICVCAIFCMDFTNRLPNCLMFCSFRFQN